MSKDTQVDVLVYALTFALYALALRVVVLASGHAVVVKLW